MISVRAAHRVSDATTFNPLAYNLNTDARFGRDSICARDREHAGWAADGCSRPGYCSAKGHSHSRQHGAIGPDGELQPSEPTSYYHESTHASAGLAAECGKPDCPGAARYAHRSA